MPSSAYTSGVLHMLRYNAAYLALEKLREHYKCMPWSDGRLPCCSLVLVTLTFTAELLCLFTPGSTKQFSIAVHVKASNIQSTPPYSISPLQQHNCRWQLWISKSETTIELSASVQLTLHSMIFLEGLMVKASDASLHGLWIFTSVTYLRKTELSSIVELNYNSTKILRGDNILQVAQNLLGHHQSNTRQCVVQNICGYSGITWGHLTRISFGHCLCILLMLQHWRNNYH